VENTGGFVAANSTLVVCCVGVDNDAGWRVSARGSPGIYVLPGWGMPPGT